MIIEDVSRDSRELLLRDGFEVAQSGGEAETVTHSDHLVDDGLVDGGVKRPVDDERLRQERVVRVD